MPNEQPKNQITMPNSVEAEQNVLCCILRSPEMQLEIIAQLKAADFYQPKSLRPRFLSSGKTAHVSVFISRSSDSHSCPRGKLPSKADS